MISGGDIFGTVVENTLINHKIMMPPRTAGKIVSIAPAGDYTIDVRKQLEMEDVENIESKEKMVVVYAYVFNKILGHNIRNLY